MKNLNWGMALASDGRYQIVDTTMSVGIRDDYSRLLSEPFTFFVAPAWWIDERLGIFYNDQYDRQRKEAKRYREREIKNLILEYHGVEERKPRPTWSDDYWEEETTDWFRIKKR